MVFVWVLFLGEAMCDGSIRRLTREGKKVLAPVTQTAERNRAMVRSLYEDALNTGKSELLDRLISEDYEGPIGQKGPAGFAETIKQLRQAVPDIRWTVED